MTSPTVPKARQSATGSRAAGRSCTRMPATPTPGYRPLLHPDTGHRELGDADLFERGPELVQPLRGQGRAQLGQQDGLLVLDVLAYGRDEVLEPVFEVGALGRDALQVVQQPFGLVVLVGAVV